MRPSCGSRFALLHDAFVCYRHRCGGYSQARHLSRRLAARGLRPFCDAWLPFENWDALSPIALEAANAAPVMVAILGEGALSQRPAESNRAYSVAEPVDWLRAELSSASKQVIALYPTSAAQQREGQQRQSMDAGYGVSDQHGVHADWWLAVRWDPICCEL